MRKAREYKALDLHRTYSKTDFRFLNIMLISCDKKCKICFLLFGEIVSLYRALSINIFVLLESNE
jgi:hypothetical protein